MNYLLVHGAFRGGWAWGRVRRRLTAAGHQALAPSLLGMGSLSGSPGKGPHIELGQWCEQLAAVAELEDLEQVVLVGHSQGGFVARAAAQGLGDRLGAIAYLDSPLARKGQRGVDMGGPVGDHLPPADTWLAPTPLQYDDHHSADLVRWVNSRMCPTPLGPSLDRIETDEPTVAVHVAFCEHTPGAYPSALSRAECDRLGSPYRLFDAPHDAPLTHPDEVAQWLAEITIG